MADVQHSTLTGSEVHEPKDISGATSGHVYTADGIGSGVWSEQTGPISNTTVSVRSKSDLPTPSVGVITLADNTTYIIDGMISLGSDRLIYGANTSTIGSNGLVDGFTYSGSGVMVTSTQSFSIKMMLFITTNASSTVFSVSGSTDGTAILNRVTFVATGGLGTFISRGVTTLTTCAVVGAASGMTFTGTHTKLSMENGFYLTWTGTLFDLNGAIFDNIIIGSNNQFDVATGTTAIVGAAASGNLSSTGRGIISDNIFTGVGTYLTNILAGDLRWILQGNQGIVSSATFGAMAKDSGRSTTFLTGGTDLLAGTTSIIVGTERLDDGGAGANNLLRHTGVDPKKVMIGGALSGKSTGGGNLICNIILNTTAGDFVVLTGVEFPTSTTADAEHTFIFPATLPNVSELRLSVIRTSGTQDLDLLSFGLQAWGVS